MDVTMKLRAACGHDSRSVDGCTNCEAADEIDSLRAHRARSVNWKETADRMRSNADNLRAELQEVLDWARKEKAPLREQEMTSIARVLGLGA